MTSTLEKKWRIAGVSLVLWGVLAVATPAFSQTASETTTTSTTYAGTISEFGPETIVIKSESSTEPMRYRYTKTTTYVDENGQPVSVKTVRSGQPVTVYYTKNGDILTASKVVVRKVTTSSSSSTTGPGSAPVYVGTVSSFTPEAIVVSSEAAQPVRYAHTETTVYMDENGRPISRETIRTGVPVTVYYTQDGGNMVASRVVVRKIANANGTTTVEEKTTTTRPAP
jgi:hypothetical protein